MSEPIFIENISRDDNGFHCPECMFVTLHAEKLAKHASERHGIEVVLPQPNTIWHREQAAAEAVKASKAAAKAAKAKDGK